MKTLIIHPTDSTTDFLSTLYEGLEDKTVLKTCETRRDIVKHIKEHDRVMMMGHGSPHGLFNTGTRAKGASFKECAGYIINDDMVELLSEKKENVFIWCNADQFVQRHPELNGFYTGMFISEVEEANFFNIFPKQVEVNNSNNGFCEIFAKHVNENCITIHEKVSKEYKELTENNEVAKYNHERLYVNVKGKQVVNEEFNKRYKEYFNR